MRLLLLCMVFLSGVAFAHDSQQNFVKFYGASLKRSDTAPNEVRFYAKEVVNTAGHAYAIQSILSPQAQSSKLRKEVTVFGRNFVRDVKQVRLEPGGKANFVPSGYYALLKNIKPYEVNGIPYFDLEIHFSKHAPLLMSVGYPEITRVDKPAGEDGILFLQPLP